MLKGAKKNIVVLKNTGSDLFSEAHFYLREGHAKTEEEDLLREACRILEENTAESPQKSGILFRIFSFLLPFFLGGAVAFFILSNFWA